MLAKNILCVFALATSALAYYSPYDSYGSVYARSAEPEDDHLSHIYSRDLDKRDLQIRDDMDAMLRVRELVIRDPEAFELYAREHGHKTGMLLGAGAALASGSGFKGAMLGAAGGYASAEAVHRVKNSGAVQNFLHGDH